MLGIPHLKSDVGMGQNESIRRPQVSVQGSIPFWVPTPYSKSPIYSFGFFGKSENSSSMENAKPFLVEGRHDTN